MDARTAKIIGTRKAGCNADVTIDDTGRVTVAWESGEVVRFVSREAFEAWANPSNNQYVASIQY